MPRVARQKAPEYTYHIMSRSISEVTLFQNDEDKQYYLSLLKRYCEQTLCVIYAYCLMDNHVHLFINPRGFDISKFMHSLNSAYVSYFNKKHQRHGHLFQGRFASTIVDSDAYALTLSAYIHNNPKDIEAYNGKEEDYPYSSYAFYVGKKKDALGLVDTSLISSFFSDNLQTVAQKYHAFAQSMKDTGILKKIEKNIWDAYVKNEYRSEKKLIARDKSPNELVQKICELLEEDRLPETKAKYRRDTSSTRAFIAYTMRILCGYTYQKICAFMGNISLSGVVRLAHAGYHQIRTEKRYRCAFESILSMP